MFCKFNFTWYFKTFSNIFDKLLGLKIVEPIYESMNFTFK